MLSVSTDNLFIPQFIKTNNKHGYRNTLAMQDYRAWLFVGFKSMKVFIFHIKMSFSPLSNYVRQTQLVWVEFVLFTYYFMNRHFPFWFSRAYCTNVTGFTDNLEVTL